MPLGRGVVVSIGWTELVVEVMLAVDEELVMEVIRVVEAVGEATGLRTGTRTLQETASKQERRDGKATRTYIEVMVVAGVTVTHSSVIVQLVYATPPVVVDAPMNSVR